MQGEREIGINPKYKRLREGFTSKEQNGSQRLENYKKKYQDKAYSGLTDLKRFLLKQTEVIRHYVGDGGR